MPTRSREEYFNLLCADKPSPSVERNCRNTSYLIDPDVVAVDGEAVDTCN